jgi:hypothetical protein
MADNLVEKDTGKNRLLDEMAESRSSILRVINQAFPDGADPAILNAIFSSHLNSGDDIADKDESIQPQQYFAEQVFEFQSKYKSNLDFALERATKRTKEALMKEYFKFNAREDVNGANQYSEQIDLIISELVGMYKRSGAFGDFIEKVMSAVSDAKNNSVEIGDTLEQLGFLLSFKWRSDPQWKQQEYMGIEFGLGYLVGLVTPAITGADKWGNIEHLYPKIKTEINRAMQSQRGQKKGSQWVDGMTLWIQEKIKGVATKKTKTGLSLDPSNRAFALSIKTEAMNYRYITYGSKWTNEQAAFEWIQKVIRKVLQE